LWREYSELWARFSLQQLLRRNKGIVAAKKFSGEPGRMA
jgi:hypothetical protein